MEECTEITVEMWKKWKEEIREKLQETATNFVLIGYRLRQIQNSGMYDGAEDVYQFAEKEYGIGKSTTSRFIAINERYGDPEDPMKLKEEYRNFTSSKLAEMLTMTDEECELITEKTKISQVRALKHFERAEIVELENVENVKYTVFQEAIIKYFEKKEKELNKALKMIKKAAGLEEDEKESVYKEIAELINPLGSVICQRGKVFVILYEFEKGVKYKIVRERKSYHLSYREFFEEMMNIYGTFMDGSNENNVHRDFYEEYRKKVNEANLKAESEEEKTQQTGEKTECEDVATSQQNEEDLPENNSEENKNFEDNTMKCIRCGEEFEQTTCRNVYCSICGIESKKEYLKAYREGRKKEKREVKCAICGKMFESNRPDAKYCGNECYEIGRKAITREWQKKRNAEIKRDHELAKAAEKKSNGKSKSKVSQLSMIQREAEKLNMTYGQYVALYGNK